jgi:formate dehydrogenase subunit gamma
MRSDVQSESRSGSSTAPALPIELVKRIEDAIASKKHEPGPLLNVLHAVQDSVGYVPAGAIPLIAAQLNLSRAEVHGVVTFYHYFRQTPPGKHAVQVCRAEACQAVNGKQLEEHVKSRLGIDYHETTADGQFSLEPVYCLGNCACGPSMTIDGEVFGRVSNKRCDDLLVSRGKRS